MKKGLVFTAIILLACGLFVAGKLSPTELQKAVQSGEMIRLHVVAAGDDKHDQEIKLHVRDAVLTHYGPILEAQPDKASMSSFLLTNLCDIERIAHDAAREMGYSGVVTASFGQYDFPDRIYAGELVPTGVYSALRIVLGDGLGANWWCVMYPPLCFVGEEAVAPGEQVDVEFTSSIAAWFRSLSKKEG